MSDKIYAQFVSNGFVSNAIFDLAHRLNRDNCFYPYYLMRKNFKQHGFNLNTADITHEKSATFALHMDVQRRCSSKRCYLMMFETSQIYPKNGIPSNWKRYRKIFTWNDDLVDGKKFVKINFPNPIHIHPTDGFSLRNRFCCLISSNKTLTVKSNQNLYPERVKAIRWFEKYAPQDFDLYGIGWDIPAVHGSGLVAKLERRFWKILMSTVKLSAFPSYRGKVEHKRNVLTKTRFAICYENVRDLPGYITEKIFDCFFSGCVPVYWGANNITDHIPANCFIDRRRFHDTEEVYHFLKAMTEQEFMEYQQHIAAFLQSDAAYPFSSEFFAETIVNTIVQDIGTQS